MMINEYTMKYSLAGLLIALLACTGVARTSPEEAPRERSAKERRADRRFLGQDFRGALALYKRIMEQERDPEKKAALCLKVARLYAMIRDHAAAADHFGAYMGMGQELPSAPDICDYLDALRFLGERQKAEAVCLHYAYENVYGRNQRYHNSLNAIITRYDTVSNDYAVLPSRASGPRSEYWVGDFMGEPFYAVSRSRFNAPGKLFFHRTRYRALHPPGRATQRRLDDRFAAVPKELQRGPVSFSPDGREMVATEIVYDKDERVHIDNGRDLSLKTRLVYSAISVDKRRFTRFQPLFHQEAGASYAHPFLFDDGRAILFTSDMSGGYGGFDLYLSLRDGETGAWGYPVNLGPTVNTEGDEIFPALVEDELFFASNGHLGLGGYDLFRARFDGRGIISNSLYHLPYPVNSPYNDFHIYPLDKVSGYIASDRDERAMDDIFYYYKRNELPGPGLDNTEQSLLNRYSAPEHVTIGKELLAVVYFDFDKARVNDEAAGALEIFVQKHGADVPGLLVIGYADEIGKDDYNRRLSRRRAHAVADWLRSRGVKAPVATEGRGKIILPEHVDDRSVEGAKLSDRITKNRRARRVEIYLQ
ncbi:MAG: OmpA family protein [Odoribacteraceae bacterium]|jgi:outer membrane protein OmpA-like peptidoglycan-associated protein|nr:OmpA family protein [Odoribacteraceae bacterium]